MAQGTGQMPQQGSARQPVDIEYGWGFMEKGIAKLKAILDGEDKTNFDSQQYMNLYTTIYNMCTQKPPHDYSEQLYNRYRDAFTYYITDKVLPALKEHRDEFLLKELHRRWDNHKVMVRWLSRFFTYLDRYYIARHSLASLQDVGLLRFRDEVYMELKGRAKDAILSAIEKERDGEQIDRVLLKNVLAIFIEVGMGGNECYENDFECEMLTASGEHYNRKAASWVEADSCPEYMLKAEECLKQEEARVDHYMAGSSKVKLLRVVETELLQKYETDLLEKENSGCAALLRDDKKEDLARMYRLFNRVPKGLEPVADKFKKHVEDEGMKLVKEVTETAAAKKEKEKEKDGKATRDGGNSHEQQYVREVLELHDKYLQECFASSSLFHKALKEAFESFCNRNVAGSSSSELMANFCDNLLKKGSSEKLSDQAIEETYEKVVKLLAYISDKDLFAEFYRKKLARRLLFDRSASDEHERLILTRLKQQCGAQFTSKMEGMVTDLALAREKQPLFDKWKSEKRKQLPIDLTVTVLTTGFWPTYKATDMLLPKEMADCVEAFKAHYEETTKHRKLTWVYALGTAVLKGYFDPKEIELVLSTYQTALLLLFNNESVLTYAEIRERLNLPDEDVARLLHSLTMLKHKILLKEPESRTIGKNDSFRVNVGFTDRLRRIRIPMPPVDEKKKVIEDVDKDRRYAIDAAIVRTMKSRKVMQHQQLIMEVVPQLSGMFQPELSQIKKRIEDLIDREYLERDKDNSKVYKYLA